MLHRSKPAVNIVSAPMAEPTDLPNVIREDLLMLAPVTPIQLYATWHISYSTQNRLSDYLGEETFDKCRLLLVLKLLNPDMPSITIDVSGPSNSRYINLSSLYSRRDIEKERLESIMLYGELSYQKDNISYYVTRSGLMTLPRLYISNRTNPERLPLEEVYERIYRRLDPQLKRNGSINLLEMGEKLDMLLGVSPLKIGEQI